MSASLNPSALARLLGEWHLGAAPAYRELADVVRLLVLDGRVALDTALPSERALVRGPGRQPNHGDGRVRPPPRAGLPQQRPGLAAAGPAFRAYAHGIRLPATGVELRPPGGDAGTSGRTDLPPGLAAPGLPPPMD